MFTNRSFRLIIVIVFLFVAACSPQVVVTPTATQKVGVPPTATQSDPVSLRLAVSDGDDSAPSGPYVLEFANQVKTLSNGKITIETIWGAGDATEVGFERGVIQLVREGKFDLGLAASRAFDNDKDHITSFQALQTPFLIDNDALVAAVATSDVAIQMLDNLSSSGLAGLTLWPEDLRHPFSLIPGRVLLSPQDFAGLNIRTTPSGVSDMMIEALGGKPMFEDSGYDGAESGLRQGASLTGIPTATGNVTFFAKYQVLFANSAAFEKLSDEQRTILREAAAAAQKKALAEHPSDAEAAATWCADGGSIVMASDEQVEAFEKAAQPVVDKLQLDSSNAKSIAAIRELKAKTKPSPEAQACSPTVTVLTQAPAENPTWSQGLLPNGVWQTELSVDDIMAVGGVTKSAASGSAGVHTFTFQDGKFTWSLEGDSPGYCEGTYALVGDFVRLYLSAKCGNEVDDIQWRLDDEGHLHLYLVAIENGPFAEIKANLEAKPYQKIANP